MNKETKIRTIVAVIVSINEALIAFGITQFEDVTADTIYTVVSTIAMLVAWGVSHFMNNDFTKEGCEGTGLTRLLKAQKKGAAGENFFDDAKEVGEDA